MNPPGLPDDPAAHLQKIGPGRLVLVVGPSGAGKDTLLELVRAATVATGDVIVARRVVTRPASGAEDHDSLSEKDFAQAVAAGAFTIAWSAHGNRYGIPASVEADIRAGRTVLCNVSRGVIGQLRAHYASVLVFMVTAPSGVLAARLAARTRHSDGGIAARLKRAEAPEYRIDADVTIENVGSAESSAKKLLDFVRQT